jgi:hypothetical protein
VAFIEPDQDSSLSADQEIFWLKRHGFKGEWYDFGGFFKWVMVRRPVFAPPAAGSEIDIASCLENSFLKV